VEEAESGRLMTLETYWDSMIPIGTERRASKISANLRQLMSHHQTKEIEAALVQMVLTHYGIKSVENGLVNDALKHLKEDAFQDLFRLMPSGDLKNVERVFELLIEPLDRKINGAFYTPHFIVKYIVDQTVAGNVRICDPSCGSGAFLIECLDKIRKDTGRRILSIIEENLYGCDILDYATRRAKILLALYSVINGEDVSEIEFNILCRDSLTMDWQREFPEIVSAGDWRDSFNMSDKGFDVVVGNPPYVRIQDLKIDTKELLSQGWSTVKNRSFNLYFPFFELGMRILRQGGKLGYITPNNYFTSLSAEPLRKYLQEGRFLTRILDFNHLLLFPDVSTYTCLTFLEKTRRSMFLYQTIEDYAHIRDIASLSFDELSIAALNPRKWRLLNKEDQRNIRILESIGRPLKEIADIHVGIATLKDDLYIIDGNQVKDGYLATTFRGKEFMIEEAITRPIRKISDIEDEDAIRKDNKRIIFPYLVTKGEVKLIPESVLRKRFPCCHEYLVEIRPELAMRDKGRKEYPAWYAYGRTQGLSRFGPKLLTPTFSDKPKFMLDENVESLFCNGYGVFQKPGELDLRILQKLLNSRLMDYFARKTSVNIEGGYQCYQKNFIESFCIPALTKSDMDMLRTEEDPRKLDDFLIAKYGLDRTPLDRMTKSTVSSRDPGSRAEPHTHARCHQQSH
jgi:hypothetical protein